MTTDTKAVARFDCPDLKEMRWHIDGIYILFADHERVVANLTKNHKENLDSWLARGAEISRLRTALAASRAEAEALRREMGMLIQDSSEARERDRLQYDCGEL